MNPEPSILEELRPQRPVLDPEWSQATLARVLSPGEPRSSSAARTRPRRAARLGVTVAAFAALTTAGVGLAHAAGVMPQSFTDAFAVWAHWPGHATDPSTAHRVATAPGPHGLSFSVLSTGDATGPSCRTAVLETPASVQQPLPDDFTEVYGDFCSGGPTTSSFGASGGSSDGDIETFTVSAGSATRAVVRTRSGHEYPALLVDGDFWGWFPAGEHAGLVGYAADGTEVGRVPSL